METKDVDHSEPKRTKRGRKWTFLFVFACIVVGAVIWLRPYFGYLGAWIDLRVFKKERKYEGLTSAENLRQIGAALQLYTDAEGAFPPSAEWMDKLLLYMRADDMPKHEQLKKFEAPGVGTGEYGYAFNGTLGSKWAFEVEEPEKTPVVYDSWKLEWNAFDKSPLESLPDPPRNGENQVLWADGSVSAAPSKR
jgi:hypothetical protein